MSFSINTNISAFNAARNLNNTNNALQSSMAKLSSGLRINSPGDDAAGFSISTIMASQISGMAQAQQNTTQGISMVQTAGGALASASSILQRVRDLAVEYDNGTYSTVDQAAITAEVTQLNNQLTALTANTKFNGISLLAGGTVNLQTGQDNGQTIAVTNANLATALGTAVSGFASATGTYTSITLIDVAINNLSAASSALGGVQERLQDQSSYLSGYQENLMAAHSAITDVDFASETANLTRLQILQQSGTAILAQANSNPQNLLALLKG